MEDKRKKNISLILLSTITVHAQWNAHIWADVTDHCCYKLTFSFCVFASLSYLGSVGVYWRKFCVFAYFAFFVFSVEFGWMSFITSAIDCLKNCLRNHLLCVSSVTWKKLTHSPARGESTKSVPGGRGCQKCARLKKMRKNLRRSAAFKQQWKKRERHGAVPWCQAICSRTWGHDERCLADGSIPRHHTSVWTRQLLVARQCAYTFAQWRVDRRRWLLPLWYKPSRLFQSTVHLYKHTQCTQ